VIENVVDLAGIEPATSSMPWKRAPSCATGPLLQGKFPPGFGVSGRNLKYSRLPWRDSQRAGYFEFLSFSFHRLFCHN
jgi:hypothetical protein